MERKGLRCVSMCMVVHDAEIKSASLSVTVTFREEGGEGGERGRWRRGSLHERACSS